MLIESHSTTQLIQIIHPNEITQYTNMITVEVLFNNKTTSHINEKVIKSYRSKH